MSAENERNFKFPFYMGYIMACCGSDDIKEYLKARDVTQEQIDALYQAAIKVSEAFYRDLK